MAPDSDADNTLVGEKNNKKNCCSSTTKNRLSHVKINMTYSKTREEQQQAFF
jgi:hypothetical protein